VEGCRRGKSVVAIGERLLRVAALLMAIGATPSLARQPGSAATSGTLRSTPTQSGSGSASLNFAHQLLRDRRYDLAAAEYQSYLATAPAGAPATAEARYGLGTAFLFLGRYADAREAFDRFLVEAPEHPSAATARFRSGEAAYMLGDLAAARTSLERYTSEFPAHAHAANAWQYLGDTCLKLGDSAAARRAYESALEGSKSGPYADRSRFGLARALVAQGDLDAAAARLRELVDQGSRDWRERALYELGAVELKADRPAEAVKALEDLEALSPTGGSMRADGRLRRAEALERLGRHDDAAALLQPLVAEPGGTSLRASYLLAGVRLRQDRPADAASLCDAALAKTPDSPMTPLLVFRSAEALAAAGRVAEARTRYARVVRDWPRDAWADDALLASAALASAAGEPGEARELALRLVTEHPESPLVPDARLIAGQVEVATTPEAAITRLEPLVTDPKVRPDVARAARLALGVAYRKTGQPEKAEEVLKDLAAMPATTPVAGSAEAQYVIGVGHFDAGRFADAIGPLAAYLDQQPKGDVAPDALAMLAVAKHETGDEVGSSASLERLGTDYATSAVTAPAFLRLGESALEAKQLERAVTLLERAETLAGDPPTRARARWNLGWARLESKQAAGAVEAFRALVTDTPDDPRAADASLALARALDEAGRTDEAIAAYDAIRSGDKPPELASRAEVAEARLLDRLGQAALATEGQLESGRERLRQAASLYDATLVRKLPAGGGVEPADVVLAELGWTRLDAGEPEAAAKAFERILAEFPGSPRAADARVVLADAAAAAGEHERVETLLEPVVAEGSSAPASLVRSALFRLGLSRFDRKEWAKAREAFGRLARDAEAGELAAKARFWDAEAAFQAGDAATAEAAFRALASEASATTPSPDWAATARLRRVECLVALERWDEALAEADALAKDVPDFVARHELDYARGRALASLARFDEARAAYQATIDAHRADEFAARAQLMRGETYFHQEKYPEALREYLRVDFAYPDQPLWRAASLLEAGKVAERMDRWAEAVGLYEKLIDQFPNDAHAAEARERLKAAREKAGPSRGAGSP
jgi:TolA-binding protein